MPRSKTPSTKSQKKEWGVWGASSLAPHFSDSKTLLPYSSRKMQPNRLRRQGRQVIAQDTKCVAFQRDFQHLIHQIRIVPKLRQGLVKEFPLYVQIHPGRPVQADKPGMQSDIGILPALARALRRPAKINRVPGHETPIPIEDNGFELPILETCMAEPLDMGGFAVASRLRHACEFGAQAFINQKPHPA